VDASKIFASVSKFCHERLLQNEEVLSYLTDRRKLRLDIIQEFQVGLFPADLRELFSVLDPKDLRAVGIIKHASKSMFKLQDLVMPIQDVYGNYIALAGRTRLSEEERERRKISKYLNSVYDKSHHLYGLNFAKRTILEKNKVYVVEGYFDVIKPHQHGIKNVVAICGAFLSSRHIALLSRYTNNIVLLLDNEPEAKERANKIVQKKQRDGISLSASNPLPDGIKDVDEFLRKYSAEKLLSLLEVSENYDDIEPIWD